MGLLDKLREASEQQQAQGNVPQREHKFVAKGWFTPAEVRPEPEEETKVVIAGLREKIVKKEYSDTYFRRAFQVIKGDYVLLLRCAAIFIVSAVLVLLTITLGLTYFEKWVLSGPYNFMAGVGIGYPGIGDNLSLAIAKQQWEVYEPIMLMAAAVGILTSIFMAGFFYCAKRIYFQDVFKKVVKTFFMGVAKYWWKFLICVMCGVLIVAAMATTIFYLLQQQALGTAGAGAYCAVVFTFVFGFALLPIPMTMIPQFVVYDLSFIKTFKNAIVFILNQPISIIFTSIIAIAPVCAMFTSMVWQIIVFIVCAVIGFILWALWLIALSKRSMDKCKGYVAFEQRKVQAANKQAQKNAPGGNKKKKPVQYQNPKKKKKK
ncbi:MAG: hypothetical protein J5656_00065 [Clostridia bacterium]|nr:hypothetical protein [Clostridia bacterium]